jgi:tetratricopeptide (TPR) repeat protein
MASIITGFEYDIFISYRQKDNKGDRWVSEFVEALKTELESTFKEEISVYFDINPHDGLLETHDVDASLKDKLKCLIFIPIISRTYCDLKSFAWEHEFKAFVEQASQDQFGMKVKLPNGNVANRVLPVRIHDLDQEDIKLCESVLGGVLRGIEFIYKEPGVNKPLTSDDDEKKNLNSTKYRIQINKVANAIKEIFSGLKTEPVELDKEIIQQKSLLKEVQKKERLEVQEQPAKLNKRKLLTGSIATAVLLLIVALFAYPKIFHSGKSKTTVEPGGKMSIVVNTFENKTGDATMDSWREILPDLLRGYLATSKELSVQNSQTMFEVYESIQHGNNASFETSQSNEVAKRLNADSYLTGSFQKIGNKTLIVVKLINTKSSEVFLTRSVEGSVDTEYKSMTDSLSRQIKNFLEIKVLEKNANPEYGEAFTNSAEAYRKYIEGMKSVMNGDFQIAVKPLEEAYRIDSTFTLAAFYLSYAYCNYDWSQARIWAQKAYTGKEKLTEDYRMWLEFWHAWFNTKNPDDVLNYCNSIEKSDIKSRFILFDIGLAFSYLGKFDKSVEMFEKAERLSLEWGEDFRYKDFYSYFASACHSAGMFDKEAKVLENGLKLFPDDILLIRGKTCHIAGEYRKGK